MTGNDLPLLRAPWAACVIISASSRITNLNPFLIISRCPIQANHPTRARATTTSFLSDSLLKPISLALRILATSSHSASCLLFTEIAHARDPSHSAEPPSRTRSHFIPKSVSKRLRFPLRSIVDTSPVKLPLWPKAEHPSRYARLSTLDSRPPSDARR
jgi:hypothetical protein